MAARIPSACLLRALRQLPYHQTACSNPSAISPITRIHHPSACRGLSNSTTLHLADHNDNNGKQRSSTLRTADLKPRRTKARTRKPAPDTEGLEERDSDPAANQGTDLNALDVFGDIAAPTTAIDACLHDGFDLNNGVKISGGDGCLLVDGEVFRWRPWESGNREKAGGLGMLNEKGQWEVSEEAWGVLKLVWPKPDLLILGLGASLHPLSPETRKQINLLGIRIEVQDTRNAAAQFNLLATERGVRDVAAALIPIGWREQ